MPTKSEHVMQRQLVGVDWGTSNRRAYLIDNDGSCREVHEDDQGMLAVAGNFAASLQALLNTLQVDASVPVVMSGMVGSAQGWREVPYLETAVPLDQLPAKLVPVQGHNLGRNCFIVPGYRWQGSGGAVDVMRGEETQLLGALALGRRDGWMVLPGTHSKWVLLRHGVIERLSTYMTGELFAAMAAHGTLAALMREEGADESSFEAGVAQARQRVPLSNALFGVRARVVTGAMPAAQARAFVSGLLIGTEFVAAEDAGEGVPASLTIIGSPALAQRYVRAGAVFGVAVDLLDPHAVYCAALSKFSAESPL